MRLGLGPLARLPALALVVGLSWFAPVTAIAANTSVIIFDNDTPTPPVFDAAQGWWSYAPYHVQVARGEPITFNSPSTNRQPHTVTSFTRGDAPGSLVAGTAFDSSPDPSTRINPGESWTLDTSNLAPGNYAYYCRLHLWMLGSVTVTQ
jgi:plastocyanin